MSHGWDSCKAVSILSHFDLSQVLPICKCSVWDHLRFDITDEILFSSFPELIHGWYVKRINKDVLGEGYTDMKLREMF